MASRRFLDTLIGRLASKEVAEAAQDGAVGGAPARADAAKLAQARKRAALWAVAWSLVRSGRVAVRTRVPRVDIAIEIKGERTGVKGRMLGGGFRALY